MTLVLALECADGLVLASDSQGTFSTTGQPTKMEVDKLFVPWSNVAWAGSGSVGVIQLVRDHLQQKFSDTFGFQNKQPATIQRDLVNEVVGVLRPFFTNNFLNIPGQPFPQTSFLFCGHTPWGSFIFEIEPNLVRTDHGPIGYAAIGSGDIFPYFALASIKHYNVRNLTLQRAKMVAHRIVDDAINVAAMGLGPPVQMVEIIKGEERTTPGARALERYADARKLTKEDVDLVRDQVLQWKDAERWTLESFETPPAPPPVEPPLDPL